METDLLLPGRTQLSSSDNSKGLGIYSIPITKHLAAQRMYIRFQGVKAQYFGLQLTQMWEHSAEDGQSCRWLLIEPSESHAWELLQVLKGGER